MKFNIPYDIAGVTLLAFGNGAPDVFSSFAAFSSGVAETGLNELLGGSMFVSNVVVGCVAIASTCKVHPWAFKRDVGALLITLGGLCYLSETSPKKEYSSYVFHAFAFTFIYMLYVLIVTVPECFGQCRKEDPTLCEHQLQKGTFGALSAFWHTAMSPRGRNIKYAFVTRQDAASPNHTNLLEMSSPRPTKEKFHGKMFEDHFPEVIDSFKSPLMSDHEQNEDQYSLDGSTFSSGASIWDSAYWHHMRWRRTMKRRLAQAIYNEAQFFSKIIAFCQFILGFARDLTIPVMEPDSWSRPFASMYPITVPLFLLLTSRNWHLTLQVINIPLWVILLVLGIFGSGVVAFTTHRTKPPTSLFYCMFFLSMAFASCIMWIFTVANEIMAILITLGKISHVSNSLLGLTVLSWGNSIGDLITNVSVARAGFPEMAIAGCIGGPVFNILVGIGVPIILAYMKGEFFRIKLDAHAWISVVFLFSTICTSLVVFSIYQYHCPSWYGRVLLGVYTLYTIANIGKAMEWF
jgi:sodium/potassium/calcium exchanger 6